MAHSVTVGSSSWSTLLVVVTAAAVSCSDMHNDGLEPEFLSPMKNVTVALGREAILVCSVKNIGEHKVGWLKAEDQTILSLHERVVTENRRIDIDVDNNTYWKLKIRQLQRSDKGCYMCQINTQVMKKQIGCVDVKVPPDIKDEETVSDITVKEGENATLACKAKGNPLPRITWKREDGQKITMKNQPKKILYEKVHGEPLLLNKVDRSQMGHYLCIASNDVPPAVSKRITLNVNFAPVIRVPNQILGAPYGTNVRLECLVESFPNSVNYWSNTKGEMILQGPKFYLEEVKTNYMVKMYLNVQNFNYKDVGSYKCLATNSMGHANGSIRLYEITIPTTMPTTTSTKTTTTTTTSTTTALPTTTRRIVPPTVKPSPASKRKNHKIPEGDRKYGGKSDDNTRQRMNGVEAAGEMETKSSSHRASRGSSRVRRSTVGQSLGIAAELMVLAATAAGWRAGCPADAAAGLVSLAVAVSPPMLLMLWDGCAH